MNDQNLAHLHGWSPTSAELAQLIRARDVTARIPFAMAFPCPINSKVIETVF